MERIGDKFKETKGNNYWIYIASIGFSIFIALIWLISLPKIIDICNCCIVLIINFLFFMSLLIGTFGIIYSIYKKEIEQKEKSREFNRKIDWEEFQFLLYKETNSKRVEFEREKYLYDEIKSISREFHKEKIPEGDIQKLQKEIDDLKTKKEAYFVVELKNDKQ